MLLANLKPSWCKPPVIIACWLSSVCRHEGFFGCVHPPQRWVAAAAAGATLRSLSIPQPYFCLISLMHANQRCRLDKQEGWCLWSVLSFGFVWHWGAGPPSTAACLLTLHTDPWTTYQKKNPGSRIESDRVTLLVLPPVFVHLREFA